MKNIEKSILLKTELDELRPISEEVEAKIMQKFRLDWNYHSNNLEGNSLTFGETKALILFGITAQGKPLKDHFEITGHNEAINWVLEIVKQERPLSENFIRELHTLILKEPYEVAAITPNGLPTKKRVEIGSYKKTPNHVKTKTGEIFRFATPKETPAKMHDLLEWYRAKLDEADVNPILLAAEFHYKFICIHPFDDGNGRTARILMNFILMQFAYPPAVIKTTEKENYFSVLRQADAGIFEPFLEFIAQNLNHSLEIMIKGAKGESIEEADDIDKELALLAQKLKGFGEAVPKSAENLLEIYDQSVTRLARVFFEKGKIFEQFYTSSHSYFYLDGEEYLVSIGNNIQECRKKIQHRINNVTIRLYYRNFDQKGLSNFNFNSNISFTFEQKKYTVKNTNNITYEKTYSEQLTDDEISNLVSAELRKHMEYIENQMNIAQGTL